VPGWTILQVLPSEAQWKEAVAAAAAVAVAAEADAGVVELETDTAVAECGCSVLDNRTDVLRGERNSGANIQLFLFIATYECTK